MYNKIFCTIELTDYPYNCHLCQIYSYDIEAGRVYRYRGNLEFKNLRNFARKNVAPTGLAQTVQPMYDKRTFAMIFTPSKFFKGRWHRLRFSL